MLRLSKHSEPFISNLQVFACHDASMTYFTRNGQTWVASA